MGGFGFSGGGFSDIFEEVFGDFMGGGRGGQRQAAQESGEDLSGLISDGVGFADREVLSTFPYVETPLGQ
jgi:hypothetical protein